MRFNNPISNRWLADPEARFYEGKYYIYVTHSAPFCEQLNNSCLVSEDLKNWELIENIIEMADFPWAVGAVWAPTIIEKNGKYYYIFATNDVPHLSQNGGIEIAVSDSPCGPFRGYLGKPLINENINGAQPIDAHLFKDDDGTIYLYYGGWRHCNVAVMNDDMTGFVPFNNGEVFKEITPPDYVEGPCMMKRGGEYYFMWSAGSWRNGTYSVNYTKAKSPLGPFCDAVKILSSGDGKLANGPGHNGILHLPENDEYLMVYHRHNPEIVNDNARFLCIDKMQIDENGNILPIEMT